MTLTLVAFGSFAVPVCTIPCLALPHKCRWLRAAVCSDDSQQYLSILACEPVKPCASQLLADSRRCAPCRVTFDNSGLAELSCPNMQERILSGLASWCDNLGLPDSHVQQWVSSLQQARPACATRDPGDKVLSAVLRVAACVGFLAQSGSVSWEHIQSLNVVLEALCFWIFPLSLRSKRSTSLSTDFLFLACGALKLVLVTAWQARAGRALHQCSQGLPCRFGFLSATQIGPFWL